MRVGPSENVHEGGETYHGIRTEGRCIAVAGILATDGQVEDDVKRHVKRRIGPPFRLLLYHPFRSTDLLLSLKASSPSIYMLISVGDQSIVTTVNESLNDPPPGRLSYVLKRSEYFGQGPP